MTKYKEDHEKEKLDKVCQYVEEGTMSLRQASDWITQQTGKYMSHESIRKHAVKRRTAKPDPRQLDIFSTTGEAEGLGT